MEGITIVENLCLLALVGNIAITILSYILGHRFGKRTGYKQGIIDGATSVRKQDWIQRTHDWEVGKYEHG